MNIQQLFLMASWQGMTDLELRLHDIRIGSMQAASSPYCPEQGTIDIFSEDSTGKTARLSGERSY
jgi:hypothetical protein